MKFYPLLLIVSLFINGCISTINSVEKNKKDYIIYLTPEVLKKLDFSRSNPISTKINDKWYFVREDGKAMPVMVDSSGKPDKFKEGLARVKIDGKIGFFNRNLDMVIEPFYEFAFPFHHGVSDICVGCREISDGDVKMLDGGEWKRIDRSGLIIEE
jgi:hypothetical protein